MSSHNVFKPHDQSITCILAPVPSKPPAPSGPPMATPLPMSTSTPLEPTPNPKPQSRTRKQPLPLSAGQEQQVRDLYYKNVRALCAEEIKAFAACAHSRTITATFVCRKQNLAMNACMVSHATPANMDKAREEWFAGWQERRKEREAEERRVVEAKKFHAEWWGLDEKGRRREGFVAPDDQSHARMLKEKEKRLREVGVELEGKRRG